MSVPRYRVAPDADWLRLDDAVLVLVGDQVLMIGGTGSLVWRALEDGATTHEMAALMQGGDAGPEQVQSDLENFLDDLLERGLVTPVPPSSGTTYRVPEHVAWTTEPTGAVALGDLRSGSRMTMSATASEIWLALTSGADLDAVAAHLRVRFPDAPAELRDEVDAMVRSLVAQDLVEPAAPSLDASSG